MISVLDIGIGNINSVCNMLDFLSVSFEKVNKVSLDTNKLIIVGNGNFRSVINRLDDSGNSENIIQLVKLQKTLILGICVGAQIFGNYSEEGDCEGLKILNFDILKMNGTFNFKVPNVGWHDVRIRNDFMLSASIKNSRFYFSHSYEMTNFESDIVNSSIEIEGREIVSSFCSNNIIGVQFHPEKSHKYGLELFKSFAKYEL